MRWRGLTMPVVCAVALSVAAGWSLAEEHAWDPAGAPAAAPEQPVAAARASGKSAPRSRGASVEQPGKTGPGVGSRALAGHEAADGPADGQPRRSR